MILNLATVLQVLTVVLAVLMLVLGKRAWAVMDKLEANLPLTAAESRIYRAMWWLCGAFGATVTACGWVVGLWWLAAFGLVMLTVCSFAYSTAKSRLLHRHLS
jgi:hypothetical protein